jgi:hypothetical protein
MIKRLRHRLRRKLRLLLARLQSTAASQRRNPKTPEAA